MHPTDDGAALETDEIITMCLLLLAGGHETTANLIGNGSLALFEHPDQLDWLGRHPDLSLKPSMSYCAIDGPAQLASRIARTDLVLGESTVRKGEQALVVLGAANRDPASYPDPDRLDLTRAGPPHLAFGSGPHYLRRGRARPTRGTGNLHTSLAIAVEINESTAARISRDDSRTFRRLQALHIGDKHLEPGRLVDTTPAGERDAVRCSGHSVWTGSPGRSTKDPHATTTQGDSA